METKLIRGDYVFNGANGTERLIGKEELLSRVLYRLSVRRGSFPFLPELGSRLHLLQHEKPMNRLPAAQQYVAEALAEERDVTVESVQLLPDAQPLPAIRVFLRYNGESTELTLSIQ